MRYRLKAKLEGQLILTENFAFDRDGLLFEFSLDDVSGVQEVAVSLKVLTEKVEKFASEFGPGQGGSQATVTIGGDRELHDILVSELQSLESNLAFFSSSVKRIHWDSPHQEFIAETPEEGDLIAITGFSRSRTYPEPHALFAPIDLIRLVSKFPAYESLRVPMAFWREGENYFTTFQYVLAFYQYYFIIEDFYAGGKTSQSLVLKEFARSEEFRQLADISIKELFKEPRHRQALERLFALEECEVGATGLQKLLFKTRGSLHHFSSSSSKTRGTPFNQAEFESIALLAMHLTTAAIGFRIAAIDRQRE